MDAERHDYEPDESNRHPMHTDPLCAICGESKKSGAHR